MSVINQTLKEVVSIDSDLKELVVDYVGEKIQPENDEVTLEMVVSVMSSEFKDLVLALAEENWIRGYHQAMDDMTEGEKLYKAEQKKINEQRTSD